MITITVNHTKVAYVIARKGDKAVQFVAYSDAAFYITENLDQACDFYSLDQAIESRNKYFPDWLVLRGLSTLYEVCL